MTVFEDEHEMSLDRFELALQLQNIMRARATHNHEPEDHIRYVNIRQVFIQDVSTRDRLPHAVRICRSLDHFWEFIGAKYGTYSSRRQYLQHEFQPLLDYLEFDSSSPVDDLLGDVLKDFSAEAVQKVWDKAIERREDDPEAAITSARSLVESVCKHVLDEAGVVPHRPDQLYRQTATLMNIAPNQQTEQPFRQLLGSCNTIVESLYAIRNRFGDAHGRSSSDAVPLPRHAELAVNVAGSLAVFLVRTKMEDARDSSLP